LDFRTLEILIAREQEIPVYPIDSDELGQKRCRELNRRAVGALNDDLPDRTSVVVQIPLCRDVEMKFELLHDDDLPT